MTLESQQAESIDALILAAGKSTRMGGTDPKVLLPLGSQKVIDYILDRVTEIGCRKVGVVIGFQADRVRQYLSSRSVIFVEQKQQRGTGHAVMVSEPDFSADSGHLLVLNGDVPLLSAGTLRALLALHLSAGSPATILTTSLQNPFGYGRVIRTPENRVKTIVEEKDATADEKLIREINAGIYVFRKPALFNALKQITSDNKSREYYLTDVIHVLAERGLNPNAYCTEEWREILGINTPEELQQVEQLLRVLKSSSDCEIT